MTAAGSAAPGVLVVGASLGGLRAAEQLRAAGWRGPITVVGDEPHMPYNRPPLSKDALSGELAHEALAFRARASVADVTWRLGVGAVAADLAARTVTLADGSVLPYAGLVVATGIRPRRLGCPGPVTGRHVVRTLEDARALRGEVATGVGRVFDDAGALRGEVGTGAGRHVVRTLDDARELRGEVAAGCEVAVIGAGFIGCEVAATLTGLGAAVTVVAPEDEPMLRPLGRELGAALRRRHERRGVRFRLGRIVNRFLGEGVVSGVRLDDGSEFAADIVVEAVGSTPNTEWLRGNGLDLSDGVLCDGLLRVEGRPDVVAVGDIARFPNARYDGVPRRVEHWSMPTDSAKRAARSLASFLAGAGAGAGAGADGDASASASAGADGCDDGGASAEGEPFAPLPAFWSDQYSERLQSFGSPALGADDVRVLEGDVDADCVVGYHDTDGALIGVVALGGAAAVAAARYRGALR